MIPSRRASYMDQTRTRHGPDTDQTWTGLRNWPGAIVVGNLGSPSTVVKHYLHREYVSVLVATTG